MRVAVATSGSAQNFRDGNSSKCILDHALPRANGAPRARADMAAGDGNQVDSAYEPHPDREYAASATRPAPRRLAIA